MGASSHSQLAFFPSRPMRMGEKVIYASLVDAVGEKSFQLIWPQTQEGFIEACDCSKVRCLVGVSPLIEDVRHAHNLMGRLLATGVHRARIRVVLWNRTIPGGLGIDVIQETLGPIQHELPFDPSLLAQAENQGCLLREVSPRAPLTQAVDKLGANVKVWLDQPLSADKESMGEDNWRSLERRVAARLWDSVGSSCSTNEKDIDQALHAALAEEKIDSCPPALFNALRQRIHDQVTGLGPLEVLMRDPSLNEIMINGLGPIFIERNGVLQASSVVFETESQLRTVIDRVVGRMGRRVDLSSPLCDVRLADGSRVNVVLPPLSLGGPVMTIRRFKSLYQSLNDLVAAGTLDEDQSDRLRRAVQERKNILVSGNSGAGKTTLLNVLAGLIPSGERIISMEDAAELQIRQPHVIRLETRPKNGEGLGQISMSDLVVNALRMRPDRLIIGECRGAEVIPMIQAMNTGHDGSMTTIHANSAADALKRLESLMLLHAPEWSLDVVREQIKAGINLVLYLKREGSERKLLEILDV